MDIYHPSGMKRKKILRFSRRKGRVAISEVLGSLIMIAITLVAGAGVFGFVNGQSGISSSAVGANAAKNINFLNEKETIVYAAMVNANSANVWVYNYGSIDPETMTNILVTDTSAPSTVCTITISSSVARLQVQQISVNLPLGCTGGSPPLTFQATHSYTFVVVGQFASTAQLTVKF